MRWCSSLERRSRGGNMTVSDTPSIDPDRRRAERLEIAHKLYHALVAQDRDRVIMLSDGDGRVVAQNEPRTELGPPENAS